MGGGGGCLSKDQNSSCSEADQISGACQLSVKCKLYYLSVWKPGSLQRGEWEDRRSDQPQYLYKASPCVVQVLGGQEVLAHQTVEPIRVEEVFLWFLCSPQVCQWSTSNSKSHHVETKLGGKKVKAQIKD